MRKISSHFKKGQTVAVYSDPISRQSLEGFAILIKFLWEDEGQERWVVQFEREFMKVERWISTIACPLARCLKTQKTLKLL